ncbi:hypothetical protein N7478_011291 [Penicillium angulare]|uniref:uncharacterized protein n=1 Tax=Penicillium angulare TaxID=116970 RepID=UPI0025424A63|nr:uncharacterized protein N7478_011291 [Penicillium angulare]KAJ5263686.1 hypothetical protein N7478_011291 [Penicillium angulare]
MSTLMKGINVGERAHRLQKNQHNVFWKFLEGVLEIPQYSMSGRLPSPESIESCLSMAEVTRDFEDWEDLLEDIQANLVAISSAKS